MSSNVALTKLAKDEKKFDLVFLDPPYAKQKIASDMKKMDSLSLLTDNAVIVAETDDETGLGEIGGFELTKTHHFGKTIVRFYRKENR